MDEKVKASWEKALHPKTLKTNIITASIFSMAFEMLKFASSGVDFDVTQVFGEMISLLRKIELWWIENLEMAINPEAYPKDLDLEQVTPGPVWSLQMLIDIALGPEEEARKYYDFFVGNTDKT